MASANDQEKGFKEATDSSDDGWTEATGESQIVLENENEGWTGTYTGMDSTGTSGMVQAHFTNAKDLDGNDIGDAFINAGRDLQNKLRNVPVKSFVKCQWIDSLDTGQKLPMRVFKVLYK